MEKFKYKVKPAIEMTDDEFEKCAHLFSMSYGKYSQESDKRPGEQIEMGKKFFISRYKKKEVYIATCKHSKNGLLVGQAIYARKNYEDVGTMTWVMQLVVSEKYRNAGIGSKLLYSIWGFSNDFAWGLATANPCTVKALERATFRKCNPVVIKSNLEIIKKFERDIQFVDNVKYLVDDDKSQIDTHFFIDNSEFVNAIDKGNWHLGMLKPGYEWLAFTFRDQNVDAELFKKHFSEMASFSENKLKDAYGRMKMTKHKWASHEKEEIDSILNIVRCSKNDLVYDFGCGTGRHSLELLKRGYKVVGIDFSSSNIRKANSRLKKYYTDNNIEDDFSCKFMTLDARDFKVVEVSDKAVTIKNKQAKLILCLYDVIGSFPDVESNKKIVENIYEKLQNDGYAAISVMNLSYLGEGLRNDFSHINDDVSRLYNLKPSNLMQTSGEIFDQDYIILDKEAGVIYRKEQFDNDGELPAEYIIRDKRYTMEEIESLCKEVGFTIVESRYVRAGNFESGQQSEKCKEILLIVKK